MGMITSRVVMANTNQSFSDHSSTFYAFQPSFSMGFGAHR